MTTNDVKWIVYSRFCCRHDKCCLDGHVQAVAVRSHPLHPAQSLHNVLGAGGEDFGFRVDSWGGGAVEGSRSHPMAGAYRRWCFCVVPASEGPEGMRWEGQSCRTSACREAFAQAELRREPVEVMMERQEER